MSNLDCGIFWDDVAMDVQSKVCAEVVEHFVCDVDANVLLGVCSIVFIINAAAKHA